MLKKVFLGLVVFLVLVLVFHSFIIGTIVKPQVERQASKMLGTSVKISVLSVRLWPGSAAVYGLKIKNPTGFSDENLLDLGSFSIALDLPGLMKEFAATHVGPQFIVVDHVKVKNLKFLFERGPKTDSGAQSNVEKLVENLNAQSESTKGSTESTKTPETAKKPIDLKIHLKLFSFIDGKVTARDAQTGSGFEYVVDKINVNIKDIYFPAKPANELIEDLDVSAKLGKTNPGTITLKGRSNLMAGSNIDAQLSIQEVGLSDFNAFLDDQMFQITAGKFDLQSTIHILNNQLQSQHNLKLTSMELAGKSGGPELIGLPLQTLLATLSRLPALHVPFEVNGDLTNPQFDIMRAIKNAIGMAVQKVLAGSLGDLTGAAKELTGVAGHLSGQAIDVASQQTDRITGDAQKLVKGLTGETSQTLEGGVKKLSGFLSKMKDN